LIKITLFRKAIEKDGKAFLVIRKEIDASEGLQPVSALIHLGDASNLLEGTKWTITKKEDRMYQWQDFGK
jgi:hypothetical protein